MKCNCETCIHADLSISQEPCCDCNTGDNNCWEGIVKDPFLCTCGNTLNKETCVAASRVENGKVTAMFICLSCHKSEKFENLPWEEILYRWNSEINPPPDE